MPGSYFYVRVPKRKNIMSILKYFATPLLLVLSACTGGYDKQVSYGYATAQQTEVADGYFNKSPLFFGKASGLISIEFELEETNVYRILGAGGNIAGWAVFEEEGIIKIINLDGKTTNILHPDKKSAYHIYDIDGTYMGVLGFEEKNPDHYYIADTYGDPLGRVSVPVHPVYNPYGYYDSWGRYHGLGYGYGNPIWSHWGHGSRNRGNSSNQANNNDTSEQNKNTSEKNKNTTEPTPSPGWGHRGGETLFDEGGIDYNNQYQQPLNWQANPRPNTTTSRVGPVKVPNETWRLNRDEIKDYTGDRQIETRMAPKLEINTSEPRLRLNKVLPRIFDEKVQSPPSPTRPFYSPQYQPRSDSMRTEPTSRQRQVQERPRSVRPNQISPKRSNKPGPVSRPIIQTQRPQKAGIPQPVIRSNKNNN